MSPRLARLLTAAYPRAWRDRYGAEFEILLSAQRPTLFALLDVLGWACYERIATLAAFRKDLAMTPRQRSLVLMMYACLAVLAAGANFYWTVDDTPLAVALRSHAELRVSWTLIRVGAAIAFGAVLMVAVPSVIAIARTAWRERRADIVGRLAVPPAAAAIALVWLTIAWRVTGGHWVPTPWDVAGDWTAPSDWPEASTRWLLGLVTFALLAAGLIASACTVHTAIARSRDLLDTPLLRGPWFTASSALLAGGAVLMTIGAFAWGWFAEQFATADFHARNGGFFDSTNATSWAMSGVIFLIAMLVATHAALTGRRRDHQDSTAHAHV